MQGLRDKRKAAKLTQQQLAEKVGLTAKAIYWYEAGKRDPALNVLKRLAEIFNCTIDELL